MHLAERAPGFGEAGAGIQIAPNGMAVLRALGLADALRDVSIGAESVELADARTGRRVSRLSLADARTDWRLIHRPRLIDLLSRAALDAGATVEFAREVSPPPDGAAPDGYDLMIGADGVRSAVRPELNGPSEPFFTGQTAWRAVIPDAGSNPRVEVFMGAGRHLVSYPLAGGLRNIVAVQERRDWTEEGWRHKDDPDNLRRALADFAQPVRDWLERVDEVYLWGLFRHPIAPVWARGRQVILGDAAHPTLPFLAQGANLALEDAWVLASLLSSHPLQDALAAFGPARTRRAARVVDSASANARYYHLSGPARLVAHTGLRLIDRIAPSAPLRRFDWLYGHDVTRTHP